MPKIGSNSKPTLIVGKYFADYPVVKATSTWDAYWTHTFKTAAKSLNLTPLLSCLVADYSQR